jgi:rhamnulokinase
MQKHYLACDLGAESGRLVHGLIDGDKLSLTEIHRFANSPIRTGESIHWNIEGLYEELKKGLTIASQLGHAYESISCDSWGVDYVLLNQSNKLLTPTYHYRDPRTATGMKRAFEKCSWPTIFSETGIQLMPLNSLFQLAAETPERLQQASTVLGVGDGFNFLLGGQPVVEISMASTFQLYNPIARDWSKTLIDALHFPQGIFPKIVKSGTRIGHLSKSLQQETGLSEIEIVATCSHDTGAAVAAVPAEGSNWAYLSSGTWSLMGIEQRTPILTDACRDLNFTNEIGYNDTIRLLKNISGLWLLQESRRMWKQKGKDLDYASLTQLATQATPFQSLVDPTDPRFVAPKDMTEAIRSFCEETGQPAPDSPGSTTRCLLESLALLYRQTIEDLQTLTGNKIGTLHIVGGGSKNALLNQLSANATQLRVITGPVEATAAGNITIQAMALGHLKNLEEARALVKNSSELNEYLPEDKEAWGKASKRFKSLCETRTNDQYRR